MDSEVKLKRYKKKRKKYVENINNMNRLFFSKMWHFILLPLLRLLRLCNKQSIQVLGNHREETTNPILYACTHIGFYDVMILFEVIKKPCWLFWGNPGDDLTTLFGWMAVKNGAILIDTYDKEDRKIAKKEAEMLLKQGGCLMIFPEGAWNVTDNLPVMKLYSGTVSMALSAGAEIIPIAIEQYNKKFIVNIGRNIKYTNEDDNIEKLNNELRDTLATLKWQIWDSCKLYRREELASKQDFVNKIISEAEGKYSVEMIENERFHDKNVFSEDEVYSFYKKLKLSKNNCFLVKTPYYARYRKIQE